MRSRLSDGLTGTELTQTLFQTIDSKGLVTANRKGLQEHKKCAASDIGFAFPSLIFRVFYLFLFLDFARTDYDGPPLIDLVEIINYVKPTALLGLSTIHGAFTEKAVTAMAALHNRPIIFPLSNPISLSEVDFSDAVTWYVPPPSPPLPPPRHTLTHTPNFFF
jgi:malate dehydrogenase (oxaloacetate-decarboxylating)(NADP+)